ncbi:MAG: response regulator [Myxococcaceae bacterium]|nr:response regulator [Myxococcaceae bacterium]
MTSPDKRPEPRAWESLVGRRGENAAPRRPARVLVVDDDSVMRRAHEKLLAAEGHEVQTAEDGEAALALLEREWVDLVLLDMLMPKLNGLEVLTRLRADPRTVDLPVLMCSGNDDMEDIVRCIELGADDYLLKPPVAPLLHARVRAAIERKFARDQERAFLDRIERERRRGDALLASLFPSSVVSELKEHGTIPPRRHDDVAVLFCDVVSFTAWCERRAPEEVVRTLQAMVQRFEEIADQHGLEKIKTIGDAFMATAGLFEPLPSPVLSCVRAAHEMVRAVRALEVGWDVRVGVHIGPVVAGVVGHKQYQFDVWGDTVNLAARVEQHARPGTVALSSAAWERVSGALEGESLGRVEVKGKGAMELFLASG